MQIFLPNIFHYFKKNPKKQKNLTTQHLKLCFIFYIQGGIEKPRNLTISSFPSPTDVMLLVSFGAMIFKRPPTASRNRHRRGREGTDVSLLPTKSACGLPSGRLPSALFYYWVKAQVARSCQTESCDFSFLKIFVTMQKNEKFMLTLLQLVFHMCHKKWN